MKKILKFLESDLPLVISGAALCISILLAIVNAVTRYTLSYTINGADAFISLCFGYTVYVGSAAAFKRCQHYGVDVLVSRLSPKGRLCTQFALDIIVLIIMILGFILSVNLMMKVGNKKFEGLSTLSYKWYDLSAVIGFGYSVIYSVEFLIADAVKVFRKEAKA